MAKRPCTEYAKTVAELALGIAERDGIRNLDDVTRVIQEKIPALTRDEIANSIVEATSGYSRALTDAQKLVNGLKNEARRDKGLRNRISDTLTHLTGGTLPARSSKAPAATPPGIQSHVDTLKSLTKALAESDPALKAKYQAKIDDLTKRLENGVSLPKGKKPTSKHSKEVQELEDKAFLLQNQIRQEIRDLRPKGIGVYAMAPFNLMRAVQTSLDLSAVFRQGGAAIYAHPTMLKHVKEMFQAAKSPEGAARVQRTIEAMPEYAQMLRSGLYLAPIEGADINKAEENFASKIAEKIPGIGMSQRAYVGFLNTLRASLFSAFAAPYGDTMTLQEAEAISHHVNILTGRGNLPGRLDAAMPFMSIGMFSPRWLASRFQLAAINSVWGGKSHGGSWRVRRRLARDHAQVLLGWAAWSALAVLIGSITGGGGDDDEKAGTIEWDPRSTDFGKFRFGRDRLDPMLGFSQIIGAIARFGTKQKKYAGHDIQDIRRGEVLGSFLRSKAAPLPGALFDMFVSGKHPDGKPATLGSTALNMVTPMSIPDIMEVFRDENVPKATAMSIISLLGMGLQHYADGERFWQPGKNPGDKAIVDWNLAHPDETWTPQPPKGFIEIKGYSVKLTDALKERYQRRTAEIASETMKRPDLAARIKPTDSGIGLMKEIYSRAAKQARSEMMRGVSSPEDLKKLGEVTPPKKKAD